MLTLAPAICTLVSFQSTCAAVEPHSQAGPQRVPLEFRRLYVPEERVSEVIRAEEYVPNKSEEFEQLVDELSRSPGESPPPALATLATYEATFDGQSVLEGKAILNLRHLSSQIATYSFDGCNLAIAEPFWEESPPREARLGTTSRGDQMMFVDKSGAMTFNWSARGVEQSNGDIVFSLALPRSASNQLDLRVPVGWTPSSPDAAIRELENAELSASRLWRLAVNGSSKVAIRMTRPPEEGRHPAAIVKHKDLTYSFDKSVVRLLAELRLDVVHRPLRQLSFRVSGPLRVRMVRLGDNELNFVTSRTASDQTIVTVEFSQPVYGIDRKLIVDAVMPPTLERAWQLPSIFVQDALWQEGITSLELVAPIWFERLDLHDYSQTDVKPLLDPPGKVVKLQQLGPDASVTVVLGRERQRASYVGGSAIRLVDDELRASCTLDITCTTGKSFGLQLDVARPWIVDSVQAVFRKAPNSIAVDQEPVKIPLEWELQSDGSLEQSLNLSLASSIQPDRDVRVELRAHRPRPRSSTVLSMKQMQVVTPREVAKEQHLIGLFGEAPYRFTLQSENQIVWFDPAKSSEQQREILPAESGGLFFESDSGSRETYASLTQSASRFKALIEVRTEVKKDILDETFRIRCEPANVIHTVLVALTRAGEHDIRWSLEGGGERGLSARKLSALQQQTGKLVSAAEPTAIDVWELSLNRPRDVPFTIVGRRYAKSSDDVQASLAWIPDASSQEGTLILGSGDGTQFDVEQTGLHPFPLPTMPSDRFTGDRAAYRYRPVDLPEVRIHRRISENNTVSAWAWSCNLQSRIAEDRSLHSACYQIENVGVHEISLRLPDKTQLRQVLIDGREVNVSSARDSRIEFELPAGVRYPTLVVIFTDQQRLPSLAGSCTGLVPEISIPVLRSLWTVWVPPDINCTGGDLEVADAVPGALAKRLLGPLLSDSMQKPFHFAHVTSAWDKIRGRETDESSKRTPRVLDAFAATLKDKTTWAELLRGYQELAQHSSDEDPLPPLAVDRLSLQGLAIAASGPLPVPESGRFEEVLDRAGLAILYTQDGIALVSQRLLSTLRASIVPTVSPLAWTAIEGSGFVDKLSLMPAEQWLAAGSRTPMPWSMNDHSGDSELFYAGWSATEFELDPGASITVQLVRRARIQVLSWGAFFFAVGLAWWLIKRPSRIVFAALLFGTVAIAVPANFSTIATACLLGLPVGVVVGIVSKKTMLFKSKGNAFMTPESASSRVSTVTAVIVLAALSIYFAAAVPGLAEDASKREQPSSPPKNRKIYAVVIPIDKDNRPVGDSVYVPRALFESLLKLTVNRNAPVQSWFLRSAEYDFTLNWRGVETELGATEFAVKYNLDVSSSTEVLLPLSHDQLQVLPERAMLNGKPIQVDWAADGSGLTFDAGGIGSHVLELAFRPITKTDGKLTGTTILIPRVLCSVLHVHLPDGANDITVPNSLGAVVRESSSRTVTAKLGPVDRLVLDWPRVGVDSNDANRVTASQMSWLTIGRGSVVMRSKFRFMSKESALDEVAIKTDSRLQMRLQPDQPIEIVKETLVDQNTTRVITFRQTGLPRKELALDVTFSVPDTSGVGNIQLPRVEAAAAESVNRWLAISMGPGLQLMNSSPDTTETIPTNNFLDQWGSRNPEQAPPKATMLLKKSPVTVQFEVSPVPVNVQAREALQLALDRDSATVQFQANIEVAAGKIFGARLRVPDDLRVADIKLLADGQPLAVSWDRTTENSVTIDASESLPDRSTLLLRGDINLPKRNDVALPNVTLESIPVAKRQVELYRRSSVRLQCQVGKTWQPVASDKLGTLDPLLGRLVKMVEPSAPDLPNTIDLPRVSVRNNDPHPSYQLVIAASRIDGDWWAEIICRLHDFQGEVDTLRLDVPSNWDPPFETEAGKVVLVTVPGSDRTQLLLQPAIPLIDGAVVRVRGRLAGSPKEVPDVEVTDRQATAIERFVALQVESANQRTEWQTNGLREAPWPQLVLDEVALPAGRHLMYRVVGKHYRARVGTMGPVAGVPQVRLVDAHLDHAKHSYLCSTTFDMEPAGLKECVLQLPGKTRLLYVSVAGQPAIASAKNDNRWEVLLSHEQLPQRIELLYTGTWPVDRRNAEVPPSLPLPQVIGVPVERTLVSLTSDGHDTRWSLQGSEVGALRQELFRLRSMTTLIDLSRTIARDQITGDRRRWYIPWAQRMVASSRNIAGYRLRSADDDKSLDAELADIANNQFEAAQDLQTVALLNEELKSTVARPNLFGAEKASGFSSASVSRIVAKGQLREVELSRSSSSVPPLWQRLVAIAVFPLVCMVLYFVFTRAPFKEWIVQWLFVFGAAFGILWWLCLTPSVVGWLIIAVFVVGALRSHGISESAIRRRRRAV